MSDTNTSFNTCQQVTLEMIAINSGRIAQALECLVSTLAPQEGMAPIDYLGHTLNGFVSRLTAELHSAAAAANRR